MIDVSLIFYFGIFLAIVGTIATAWGPGVNDPIVRTFNTEVASIGVCLVLFRNNIDCWPYCADGFKSRSIIC